MQFGQPLGNFELVKEKLAYMQAGAFAMEACTYQTAALIDSGEGDYMLETAMLKVFATEALWRIVNDTFQLHGGQAYFTDQPFERMMRDARINTIGEGANDVLRAFIALVGMRDVGLELQGILDAIYSPLGNLTRLGRFAGRKLGSLLVSPTVPVRSTELEPEAAELGRLVGSLGTQRRAAARAVPARHRRSAVPARPHRRCRDRALRQRLRPQPARLSAPQQPRPRRQRCGSTSKPAATISAPPAAASASPSPPCGTTTTKRQPHWPTGHAGVSNAGTERSLAETFAYLHPQRPHGKRVEQGMHRQAGQEAVRPLVQIAHAGGQHDQRNPVGAVGIVQQREDRGADHDRQPGDEATQLALIAGLSASSAA